MSADTPQSAPTGVFLYKYGCLYPAADFYRGISTQYGCLCPAASSHRGISAQIWMPVPRSQLLPGYFYANMGACTPQPALNGVFPHKYGRLYPTVCFHRGIFAQIWVSIPPAHLPLAKTTAPLLAKAPHFLNPNVIHTKHKKPASPTIRGRGHSYTLHPYYSFIFASFFAWSAAMQASMISWISPFMILSSLYRVRLIRWSVTLPCGKL